MSGLLGAVGSFLGDTVGSWFNNRKAEKRQHEAQDFSAQQYASRYQTTVKDLVAAGLNPMLAYSNGPGSSPTSSAPSVTESGIGSRAVQSYNASRSTTAQVANVNADTIKKAAEARNVEQDTLLKQGMVEQVAAMVTSSLSSAEQARAMAAQIRQSIPKIEHEIENIKAQVAKNKSDVRLNESLIAANSYLNSLRMAETRLAGQRAILQDPKVKAYSDASKKDNLLGVTSAVGDVMQNFYRMLNPFYREFRDH